MLAKPQMWWPGINRQHPLARGLVGCWPLWEGAGSRVMDVSGHGQHGALINMEPGDWTAGPVGHRLLFGGTNEYVAVPGADCGFNVTNQITVAILGKFGGNEQVFFELSRDGNLNTGAVLFQEGGNLSWRVMTVGPTNNVVVALTPKYAVHVATYGQGQYLYRDGALVVSNVANTGNFRDTLVGGMQLASHFGGFYLLVGPIDFAAVWNRYFASSEVAQLSAALFAMLRPPSIARRYVPAAGGQPTMRRWGGVPGMPLTGRIGW